MALGTVSSKGFSDINVMRQHVSMLDFPRHSPVGIYLNAIADRLEGANARVQGQCLKLMESVVVASEWMLDPGTAPKSIAPSYIVNAMKSVQNLDTFLATPSSQDASGKNGHTLDQLPQLVCAIDSSVTKALASGSAKPTLAAQVGPPPLAAAPEMPAKNDAPDANKSAPPKR